MSKNQEDITVGEDDAITIKERQIKTKVEGVQGSSNDFSFSSSSNIESTCSDVEKSGEHYGENKISDNLVLKLKDIKKEDEDGDGGFKSIQEKTRFVNSGGGILDQDRKYNSCDSKLRKCLKIKSRKTKKGIPGQVNTATKNKKSIRRRTTDQGQRSGSGTTTTTTTGTPNVTASKKETASQGNNTRKREDEGQNFHNVPSPSTSKSTPSNEEKSSAGHENDYTRDKEEYKSVSSFGRTCPMKSSISRGVMNGIREDINKFHVLDETDESESDKSMSEDSDVPDEEVERMLEDAYSRKRKADQAGLDSQDHREYQGAENGETPPFEEKDKVVLVEKGRNHFDVLPEGWMQVTHNSGMPLYLHKTTRVCTLSRPYFLGPGSARKHEIPLSAIPCLSYRRHVEEEERELAEAASKNTTDGAPSAPLTPLGGEFPSAKIQTVEESLEAQNLTPEQLRDYCKGLFEFKTIRIVRFKSWLDRRQYTKRKKQERQLQRPMLPDGTKLITFPIQSNDPSRANNSNTKKEWIMNPNGKSYVCILHEYVQHALKKQPAYKFTELENAATPYAATVSIDEMQYGVGYGTSKKQAKSEAAKNTLEILIPEMKQKITRDEKTGNSTKKENDYDTSFFDEIRVEDPRVADFCAKTTEPSPHDILLTCLQRNFGLDTLQISYQGSTVKHQMNEFTMTVGKHTATVLCRNKRDGKQRAAQKILQALHPHITSWGSLLRLYGNRSVKCFKEKKLEEQEITLLQSKAAVNSPNFAILDKLKLELSKLRDKRGALKPIGVFIAPGGANLPRLSSSNLKNVDL